MMLTIGQVAARTGLRASAIRYYEELGLLPKTPRQAGRRLYDASVFDRLAVIDLAKTAGFELRDIKLMIAEGNRPASEWRSAGKQRRQQIDQEMKRLRLMKQIVSEIDRCSCGTQIECAQVFRRAKARYLNRRGRTA
jgi:MerR family transcriptional regulator, redox-sensitive transcriptional activator SoxR